MKKEKIVIFIILSVMMVSVPCISQTSQVSFLYNTDASENWVYVMKPNFKFVNNTGNTLYLNEYTIRYYYTKEGNGEQSYSVNYSTISGLSTQGLFANDYIDIEITSTDSVLYPGEECEFGVSISKNDYTAYDQTDDYSFNANLVDFTEQNTITLYRNGSLISGTPPVPAALPTPNPDRATLTIIHDGNEHLYSTEVLEIDPIGVYAGKDPGYTAANTYWYEKGSVVRIEITRALTPAPTIGGGQDYQSMYIDGTKGPVYLTMDEDKSITIEYIIHIVTTPTPEATPSPTPDIMLLHLNVIDDEASEEGPDTARVTIAEEWTGSIVGDGWMEYDYIISGSATNGVDYEELSGKVWVLLGTEMGPTPPPGAERNSITITPIDDTEYERTETVTLTIIGYGNESVSINILDNDTLTSGSPGDVDENGTIDIIDALLVCQLYVGLNPSAFTAPVAAGDVNCDNVTDIIDALLIAQYYVGIITSFCE
ncbi:MAG: hypothetical protein JXJ04_14455 [Spirochaetales bacterium]|nr:hypothetical protein [Spirochaetales bacterium]